MSPVATGHFDGDTAVLRDATGNRSRVTADPGGRFALGAGTWHWFISAPYMDPEVEAALLADHQRLIPQEGEGLVTITLEGSDPVFPALLPDGWANPHFRRSVAEVVVAWTNATYRKYQEGSDRAYWEGDTIVHIYSGHIHEDGYAPVRIQPDDNGRYRIGSYWAWERRWPQ